MGTVHSVSSRSKRGKAQASTGGATDEAPMIHVKSSKVPKPSSIISSITKPFTRKSQDRSPEASKTSAKEGGPAPRLRMKEVAPPEAPRPLEEYSQYRDTQEVESIGGWSPTLPFGAMPSLYSATTFSTASVSDTAFKLENLRRQYRLSQEDLQQERDRYREQGQMYDCELAALDARHQQELAALCAQHAESSSGKGKRRG